MYGRHKPKVTSHDTDRVENNSWGPDPVMPSVLAAPDGHSQAKKNAGIQVQIHISV